jgi:hypothetical protein
MSISTARRTSGRRAPDGAALAILGEATVLPAGNDLPPPVILHKDTIASAGKDLLAICRALNLTK